MKPLLMFVSLAFCGCTVNASEKSAKVKKVAPEKGVIKLPHDKAVELENLHLKQSVIHERMAAQEEREKAPLIAEQAKLLEAFGVPLDYKVEFNPQTGELRFEPPPPQTATQAQAQPPGSGPQEKQAQR